MRMNCMLYRNGRLSPLVSQLPGTFHVLGYHLREVAEAFWAENPKVPRGVPGEMRRFAAFLRRRMAQGALPELLPEVLEYEMETYELALLPPERTRAYVAEAAARARPDAPLRPHPLVGVARFSREPFAVVRALRGKAPAAVRPRGARRVPRAGGLSRRAAGAGAAGCRDGRRLSRPARRRAAAPRVRRAPRGAGAGRRGVAPIQSF